jgi:acyl-CoA synthetase (AMP-forming)/AMP-acid ligase II
VTLGGENIFPLEIEECIVEHPSIIQASVVGVSSTKYGETVGAFLQHRSSQPRPPTQTLRDFVRQTLAWHKAPEHVFWLKEGEEFPKTGSGKIKKHLLKEKAEWLLRKERRIANI